MKGLSRIGIIGAAGWLGGAIADAVVDAGLVVPEDLALSYRAAQPTRLAGAFWTKDNQELADRSDVIILSVRPQDWPAVDFKAQGKLVVSVMAGIRLGSICDRHDTGRAVRALPNAATEVCNSYTPWVGSEAVSDADRQTVKAIFDACGVEDEVVSEDQIDYLTGLTGSGPAFPALLAAAMIKHAVESGLSPNIARRAVTTVLTGAGRMLELRPQCPNDTVNTFLDYRGTTAAAIVEMRAAGFDQAVASGLAAAFEKSVKMGDAS